MASYLDAVKSLLPKEYATQINGLDASTTALLEAVVRFTSSGECPSDASASTRSQWAKQQAQLAGALERLKSSSNNKRIREDDSTDEPEAKRSKPTSQAEDSDKPLYTLHSISVSTPIRKKVDIIVYQSSIRLVNPTTNATEQNIPLSHLKRAFLLPTRGKTKPHWTVLIMSSDTPAPAGKAGASASAASKEEQPQIVFGVDATPPPFSVTNHVDSSSSGPTSYPKGTAILPYIEAFLSHLPFKTLKPDVSVFRSALSTGDGSAGVEGYRGAKAGTLWFLSQGILWDGKPCEFWSLSDLVAGRRSGKGQVDVDLGGAEGVRTVSATGRTCSVIVSRKVVGEKVKEEEGVDGEGEEEDEDEEQTLDTDIGMVDGKEQEGIARWVKKHRSLFGVAPVQDDAGASAAKPQADEDDSDAEDSDFEDDSSSDGGSPTSSSGEDEDDEGGGSDKDDDAKSEDLGSGSDRSEDGEEAEADGDVEEAEDEEDNDEGEEEDMDPAHHPLLRPGAMPRMSRAAIDAVVGMVEKDLMAGATSLERRGANDTGESGDEEEDELED